MDDDVREAYHILGLDPAYATAQTVRQAYRRLAQIHHPDKVQDVELKRQAHHKMVAINNAYDVLTEAGFPKLSFEEDMTPASETFAEAREATKAYGVPQSDQDDLEFERWRQGLLRGLGIAYKTARVAGQVIGTTTTIAMIFWRVVQVLASIVCVTIGLFWLFHGVHLIRGAFSVLLALCLVWMMVDQIRTTGTKRRRRQSL